MKGSPCDFCHKLVKPTELGVNPYPNDPNYTADIYDTDQADLAALAEIPPTSGDGMYVVSSSKEKRGPFVDARAKHKMFYSPFHKEAALCGTCHDVSNPAFSRQPDDTYLPNEFDTPPPDFSPYALFPVERTYSEWIMSEYNSPTGVLAPQFGGNKDFVSTCQDCHMKDVSGYGCNKRGTPFRDDLPLHDLTGGNTFVPGLIAQLYPDDVNVAALANSVVRATAMLQKAATMDVSVTLLGAETQVDVHLINETGHKLPSGYPEGRRIWLNVKAFDASGSKLYESGGYDPTTGILTHDADLKIYECKPGISAELAPALDLPAGPSFHFVLNHKIFKDNRIPPRGFTNANFVAIQSPPVDYSYADGQYWDDTQYLIPGNATRVEVMLYYQTTTKEFIEFLRDENHTDNAGQLMYDLWINNGKAAPVVMNQTIINIGQPVPPVAEFAGTPTSGTAPLTVAFNNQSTNTPTSWLWSFGDGQSSTDQHPAHTYNTPGVYTVSLTATNSFGSDGNTKTDYITATEQQLTVLHVADITVSRFGKKRIKGSAVVTIVDAAGSPVSGAVVSGDFSGSSSGSGTASTDANGLVTFQSDAVRNPVGEWCFTVTDVTLADAIYDATANLVTQACESGWVAKGYLSQSNLRPFALEQNHPNPFNPSTQISFYLDEASYVTLEVFNVMGQKIETLIDRTMVSGQHAVTWDGTNQASGVYLYRLQADGLSETRRMLLMK